MDLGWIEMYLYNGIDLKHYDIIGCIPQKKKLDAVFLLRKKTWGFFPWCIKHKGDNGRYFRTFHDMVDYYFKRYSKPMNMYELRDLSDEYRRYSHSNGEIRFDITEITNSDGRPKAKKPWKRWRRWGSAK